MLCRDGAQGMVDVQSTGGDAQEAIAFCGERVDDETHREMPRPMNPLSFTVTICRRLPSYHHADCSESKC